MCAKLNNVHSVSVVVYVCVFALMCVHMCKHMSISAIEEESIVMQAVNWLKLIKKAAKD